MKGPTRKLSPRIARILRGLTALPGALLVILAFGADFAGFSSRGWSRSEFVAAGLGVALIAAAAFLPRLRPHWALFCCASANLLLICGLVLTLARVDPFYLAWKAKRQVWPPGAIGLWQPDPRYGYAHRPGVSVRHREYDYRVNYTIDAEGARATPDPPASAASIAFLGCSFTFGYGVEDGQCFPAILGAGAWNEFKVRNRAVSGYGTAHAYLLAEELLAQDPPPSVVLYGWIDHHLRRNYLSGGWLQFLDATTGQRGVRASIPHFEIENGELAYKGLAGTEQKLEDSQENREKELEISVRLVLEMNRRCRERGVPFFILLLPAQPIVDPELFLAQIRANAEIAVIDLRRVPGGYYAHDPHPKPDWHENVAAAIAAEPRIKAALESIRAKASTPR